MRKKIILSILLIIILIESVIPIRPLALEEPELTNPSFIDEPSTETEPENDSETDQDSNAENETELDSDSDVEDLIYSDHSVEDVNKMTGLDLRTGILMEPTLDFFTLLLDSIMTILSGLMLQEDNVKPVMVKKEEKIDLGSGKPFDIDYEEIKNYESASRNLNHIKYPNFKYSPEEIFKGDIDLLDINFISNSNSDDNWRNIRTVVSGWYKTLRMAAIVGLLSVLIYIGIKIIISSNSRDKSKYKEMLTSWFIGVILAFSMQYIMAFILATTKELLTLLGDINGTIRVSFPDMEGTVSFTTNLMGLARFQMQQQHFTAKIGHLVIYTALVTYTLKFTFIYLKRVLKVAFLTMISPIVALTYPLDKVNDGKAQGFDMWLKEYIFNALLQPLHYFLYYILVSSSLSLAVNNPIYGIAALMFMTHAEKLLKSILGFGKARAGTVGGLSGAFTTGVITTALTNFVKDPTHPFDSGKKGGSSSGETGSDSSETESDDDEYTGINFNNDTKDFNNLIGLLGIEEDNSLTPINEPNSSDPEEGYNPINPQKPEDFEDMIDTWDFGGNNSLSKFQDIYKKYILPYLSTFFGRYRKSLPNSLSGLGGLSYDMDDGGSFEDILKMLAEYKRTNKNPGTIEELKDLSYEELKNILRARLGSNEFDFFDNNINPQYIDADPRESSDILEEIMELNELAANPALSLSQRQAYMKKAQKLLNILKIRMAQNEYIDRLGGPLVLRQQEQERLYNLLKNNKFDSFEMLGLFSTGTLAGVELTGGPLTAGERLTSREPLTAGGTIKEETEGKQQTIGLKPEIILTQDSPEKLEDDAKQMLDPELKVKSGEVVEENDESVNKSAAQILKEAIETGIIKEEQIEEIVSGNEENITKSTVEILKEAVQAGIIKEDQIEKIIKGTELSKIESDLRKEIQKFEPIVQGVPNKKQSIFAFSKIFRRSRRKTSGIYESLEGETDRRKIREIKARNSQRQWKQYLEKPKDKVKMTNAGEVVKRNVETIRESQILSRKTAQGSEPKVQPAKYGQGKIVKQRDNNFKEKPMIKGFARVGDEIKKSTLEPIWDVEKDGMENSKRLAGNIAKGVLGATVGVAAAAVQMGISITDGKYNPLEGAATIGAGIAGVSNLGQTAEQRMQANQKDQQSLEKYGQQWFNRDDVISKFNIEYPGEGKEMRRRAVKNYVSRGITDFKDQKEGIKYANTLMEERGLNQEEADKIAIATLQYKKDLLKTNSYTILFNEKKRSKYIDTRVEAYGGSASKESVKRLHDELIQNVRDFDRVNS